MGIWARHAGAISLSLGRSAHVAGKGGRPPFTLVLMAAALVACASPEPPEGTASGADTPKEVGSTVQEPLVATASATSGSIGTGDRRSPGEIRVRWQPSEDTWRGALVPAIVDNLTERTIVVDVFARVAIRTGEQAEVLVHHTSLAAKASSSFEFDAASLPLQTAGIAATVSLVARWERSGPTSTDMNDHATGQSMRTISDSRHFTWNSKKNFSEVDVRTEKAQTKFEDGERKALRRPRFEGIREFDSHTRTKKDRSSVALEELPITGVATASSIGGVGATELESAPPNNSADRGQN